MNKPDSDKLRRYVAYHPDALQRQIAVHFGCTQNMVSQTLKLYNIPYTAKRRGGKKEIRPEELQKYVYEHPNAIQRQIAAHFGCDPSTVSDALKRCRIPYINKQLIGSKTKPKELQKYVHEHQEASQRQIADQLGCSIFLINKSLKQYNIPYVKKNRSGRPVTFARQPDKLREYIREHPDKTQTAIAAHFGCDPSCVSVALKKHGIPYVRHNGSKMDVDSLKKYVRENPFARVQRIAQDLDMPEGYISSALIRYGISANRDVWKAEAIKAYIRIHPDTLQKEIAEHFNVSPSVISRKLKKYGIKL
jgi:DNA-binding MarR family transcriptional regulator